MNRRENSFLEKRLADRVPVRNANGESERHHFWRQLRKERKMT